ncbi:MAG: Uma2 family endonuclease, partial [Okeania sp. SIO2H7]|nr:Uma2 family endonuclease [Okeania sp. SIO2H7]
MTIALNQKTQKTEIFYPTSDGEPVAETHDHFYAISLIAEVLRRYLKGQRATVLADQFLYYEEGKPESRTAPDVMVIFDVEPGGRDSYKIWEEGSIPKVVFEITSPSTKNEDKKRKKNLYEKIGIEEYWLFDPKGQWIKTQLLGYRLKDGVYEEIRDSRSAPLKLELKVEGKVISFYREDTGQKLFVSDELEDSLRERTEELEQQTLARQEAEKQAEQERERAEQERERAEQERERAEQERERAEQERERAEQQREKA